MLEDSMEVIKNRKYLYTVSSRHNNFDFDTILLLIDYSREFEEKATKFGFIILGDINIPS